MSQIEFCQAFHAPASPAISLIPQADARPPDPRSYTKWQRDAGQRCRATSSMNGILAMNLSTFHVSKV